MLIPIVILGLLASITQQVQAGVILTLNDIELTL